MESKKINRDILLLALLFTVFVVIMAAIDGMIAAPGDFQAPQSRTFFELFFMLLVLTGIIGSGLSAGLYLTFSDFVLKSLARLPADESSTAFNAVNETVQPLSGRGRSLLIPVLILTAIISLILLIVSLIQWRNAGNFLLISGSVAYLFSFIITVAYHIPRNNRLLSIFEKQHKEKAVQWWKDEASGWTFWNTVRGCAALSASILFILALRSGGI